MKWIYILLIGTLLLCSSGIVSAANDTSLTLFTAADTTAAQKTIDDSGIGYVFALMDIVGKYLIFVIIFVLLIMGMLYRMMNNSERYKDTLAAILWIVGILLIVQVAYSMVTGMIPDISTISL
jgi:predicted ferric reductase